MMMAIVTAGIDDDGYVNVNKIHMLTQGEATCNHMMHNPYLCQSRHINTCTPITTVAFIIRIYVKVDKTMNVLILLQF